MSLYAPFPKGFVWGAATAAYQVEGAAAEDGRAPSVWDTLSHKPGAIALDQTGDRACDHYHRYPEDINLMKNLGLTAYRFSASWSRVFPEAGKVNAKGVEFYDKLIDALLAAGIQPWLTLFHWDLPQWCEDKYRGWESKQCARDFADYAAFMGKTFGDRVAGFMTINEFACFLDSAYKGGEQPFAPANNVSKKVLNQTRHHAVYGHGLAVQALRAACPKPVPIGLAENIPNVVPLLETPQDILATQQALRELAGMYLAPIMEGAYPREYLTDQAADAPQFTDDEMKTIGSPIDFVGLNLYAPTYIRQDSTAPRGWSQVACDENYPKMHMPWLNIGPGINYWAPRTVKELWKPKAIYITENGCAYPDRIDSRGEVMDLGRMMYLQQHLISASRAANEGFLNGYFLWSLLDNFEWTWGYTKRFGIHYVNYETMERTPKLSAKFYAGVIARNAVGA